MAIGRPKLPAGKARSVELAIRMRPSDVETLRIMASRHGQTLSGMVREMLESVTEDYREDHGAFALPDQVTSP